MKQVFVIAALLLGGGLLNNNSFGQVQNRSDLSVLPAISGTTPAQIANEIFRFKPGLVTHFLNGALPSGGSTGFGATDRWLSFGQVTGTTQDLFGFRTQVNGRGLASGYSIPSGGSVSNPFIEWIGNSGPSVPGNLEFNYALSPTGAAAARVNIFTMAPSTTGTANTSNSYAQNGLLGHFENTGTLISPSGFGTFNSTDKWIGIGNPPVPNNPLYGMRTYWNGFSLNSAVREDNGQKNAIIEWGGDESSINGLTTSEMKFRYFSSNTNPASALQILAFKANGNSYFGSTPATNDYSVEINNDGKNTFACNTNAKNGAVIFAGLSTTFTTNVPERNALVARAAARDLAVGVTANGETSTSGSTSIGVFATATPVPLTGAAGIAGMFYVANPADYAIMATGQVLVNGITVPSDRKLKTNIAEEESALAIINKLQPVNYNYDTKTYAALNLPVVKQHGFVVQDVEKILPELVSEANIPIFENGSIVRKENIKAMNYIGVISYLQRVYRNNRRK